MYCVLRYFVERHYFAPIVPILKKIFFLNLNQTCQKQPFWIVQVPFCQRCPKIGPEHEENTLVKKTNLFGTENNVDDSKILLSLIKGPSALTATITSRIFCRAASNY